MSLNKRYKIYILSKRRDIVDDDSLTIFQGPNDVWFYPYSAEGYESEEQALVAMRNKPSTDEFVILPVYRNE